MDISTDAILEGIRTPAARTADEAWDVGACAPRGTVVKAVRAAESVELERRSTAWLVRW